MFDRFRGGGIGGGGVGGGGMVGSGSRGLAAMMGYMPRPRMPMFKPFPMVNSPPEEIILGRGKADPNYRQVVFT